MGLRVKSNTRGMGPLSFLMGRHSTKAEGKHGTGYGYTKKDAVKDYNRKYGNRK